MSQQCKELRDAILSELDGSLVFGNRELLELLLIAFIARGHLLIEGPPGTGKTLTAKLFAHKLAKSFKRIQFTSDLLPGDILGSHLYSPATQSFQFIPGPIFTDVLVADEINRTPPRTQSALLEAMEERQVTVESQTILLSDDFFVIATQNPFEMEGTFPLPEAQVDRFLFKVSTDHASSAVEVALLQEILKGGLPPDLSKIQSIYYNRTAMDTELAEIRVDPSILTFISSLLQSSRKHPQLARGSSIRGGIGLVRAARIKAGIDGRTFVIPDDVLSLAPFVLAHRVQLSPEAQISNVRAEDIVKDLLRTTEFPT